MSDLLPYDITEVATGAVAVLLAPGDITAPSGMVDVRGEVSPYTPKTFGTGGNAKSWRHVGATTGPVQYARNLTTQGVDLQQAETTELEQVNTIDRTIQFPFAEASPENLAVFELAATEDDSLTGYTIVKVGTTKDLGFFRLALIGVMQQSQGIVKEPGGLERGRLIARIFPKVSIAADNAQVQMGKGNAWEFGASFKAYPDGDLDTDEANGYWITESARTISS